MKQKKVDNITIILGAFEKYRTYANTLLVEDKENAIIDPGAKYENLKNLSENYHIKKVFYSHYHVDHARYNSLFAKAQKFAHQLDAPCLESIEQFSKYTGVHEEEFEEEWQMIMRQIHGYEETRIDVKFNDREVFKIGETTVEMIHTPGHTPGHVCVYFPEKRIIFLADIDLTPFGPWYGNAASDIDQFIASIEKLQQIEVDIAISGHLNEIIKDDYITRLKDYGSVFYQREEELLDFLKSPKTIEEIVEKRIIYRKLFRPKEVFDFMERVMIEKHLERLKRADLISKEGDKYYKV